MTRSQGKLHCVNWVVQIVNIVNPPISSPAALALLAKHYYSLDRSIYSEHRMTRLRNKWMKKQKRENLDKAGGLTCQICGRPGLQPHANNIYNKATLDHIVDIKLGGKWDDPNNFQVACYKCNRNKNILRQKPLDITLAVV